MRATGIFPRGARRAAALLAAIGLAAASGCAPARPPVWELNRGARLPLARWGSAVVVADGRVFVAGGWSTRDLRVTRRFDAYDPAHDRWTRLPDLPDSISHVIPARVGRRLWFAGGYSGSRHVYLPVSRVWTYDLDDSTWRRGPPLPEARGGGGLALVGDTLHFVGGFPLGSALGSAKHWVLDPVTDTVWAERAPLPAGRGHLTVAVANGLLYALGGQSEHDEHDVAWCTAYDPRTNRWRALADLPTPRSHVEPGTIVEGNRIVVIGGCDNSCWRARRDLRHHHWRQLSLAALARAVFGREASRLAVADVTVYDIERDRWSELPGLPEPLLAPTAALVGGRVIVSGGSRAGWSDPQSATRIGVLPPLTASER